MNYLVTPFHRDDHVALFRSRRDEVWRTSPSRADEYAFLKREVVSVLSTECGHFLLVLQGEELITIRDVCRNENVEFLGTYPRHELEAVMADLRAEVEQPTTRRPVFSSVLAPQPGRDA